MKDSTLKIYDARVTRKWDIEKVTEYFKRIHKLIKFTTEVRGKPLTIEYVDENLNVIYTEKIKGDEKKFLEYEARVDELISKI